ncbi:MAG: hypothetical protein RLZ98_1222, partial [Pseudomonadota bacterium]
EALQRAAQLDNQLRNVDKTPVRFQAIPSVPCFELWFLLHYRDVYEYYTVDDLLRLLQNHLPNYRKAREGIYADMQGTINQAMARACNLKVRYNAEAGDKPYTDFDDLVSRLLTLMNGEP